MGEARAIASFIGRPALGWGAVTLAAGFVTFALDLALALALQRFLVSIGLIAASATPAMLAPIQNSTMEAAIFLAIGTLRCGASWMNAASTGLCYVAFESGRRQDILLWAVHSGRASLGEVTTLFNDVVVGASAAVSNMFFLVSRALFAFGVLVALASYSLPLTGLLLLVVALAAPLQRVIDRRLTRDSKVIQSALADVVDRLVLAVKNAVFLQIHGMVAAEARRGGALVERYAASSRRYYIDSASRSTIPQLLGLFVVAGIAIQGSAMLGDDKSRVVAYLYLALRLFQNLGEIARFSANLRLNWPRLKVLHGWWTKYLTPVRSTIETDHKTAPVPFAVPVGWHVRDISFAWEPDVPVLRSLSFDIAPRALMVIVGPSGTGKSTLLLLLAGLLNPEQGSIRLVIDGREADLATERDSLLASAAYVGPDPFVVPGTIRDFLALGRTEPLEDSDAFAALRRAHCEFVETLPRGLDHELTEQGGGLSAGQKQRLALARALLRRPRVLFLDEATANLDAEAERVIVRTLDELKSEMTIVAVTHRQALLEIADEVIEITPVTPGGMTATSARTLEPTSA
jgi:ABC-type multidrug transport system fused ATPase/permease subunit